MGGNGVGKWCANSDVYVNKCTPLFPRPLFPRYGKPVAFLQSPGIAHPTKSKVEFGCMGIDGFFDDLKIWNAAPAK